MLTAGSLNQKQLSVKGIFQTGIFYDMSLIHLFNLYVKRVTQLLFTERLLMKNLI